MARYRAYTSIAQNADICFAISTSDLGLTPLDAGYGPAIFDPDADREIISVDIERDFDILAVQVRSRRIVKPRDFATRHNQAAHRLAIAAPALEVSAVGLGCATMTPFYDEPDRDAAIDTLRRA